MSERELAALQQLARSQGTSLTRNPVTGLPEAGALDWIIPIVAGIGSTFVPFVKNLSPVTVGLLAGAGAAIANKGDLGEALKWGLGVGGGAGLGQGLQDLGRPNKAPIIDGSFNTATGIPPAELTPSQVRTALQQNAPWIGTHGGGDWATPLSESAFAAATGSAGPSISSTGANELAGRTDESSSVSNMKEGINKVLKGDWKEFNPGLGALVGTGGAGLLKTLAAGAVVPALLQQPDPLEIQDPWGVGKGGGKTPSYAYESKQPYHRRRRSLTEDQGMGEFSYFEPEPVLMPTKRAATGGIMDLARGGAAAHAPNYGGYLDGPGDGMSDSIHASIEDKQPARLADGEFVIPADVVSHLGNGSSKAGAKRLYQMMDKIRLARTGTSKQGREINPDKYLPA